MVEVSELFRCHNQPFLSLLLDLVGNLCDGENVFERDECQRTGGTTVGSMSADFHSSLGRT